jgi:hypothetical protein
LASWVWSLLRLAGRLNGKHRIESTMTHVSLIGILGLVAIAACWALAVVLFRVSNAGTVARKLAVLLVVEGFVLITAGFPEFTFNLAQLYYGPYPKAGLFLVAVHFMCDVAMIALYPPFLASALNTKLTRPFANKRVRIGLAIGATVLVPGALLPDDMRIGVTLLYLTIVLLFVFALVASIHAWRIAEKGIARKRAGIFALAFGLRDIGWILSYGIGAWLMWTQVQFEMTDIAWLGKIVYALGTLLAVPLIAYGVLRTQLFDIDLRIRWTIKQSTLAGAIVATMFILSEGADRLLSSTLGDFVGLWAAAIVMFFLAPLQRFAERVASAAMPNTRNTPEYAAFRKMQVYEAALSEALIEGGISTKERTLLTHLRDSLGVSESDAQAIELELQNNQLSMS